MTPRRLLAFSAFAMLSVQAANATTYFDSYTGQTSAGSDGYSDSITIMANSFAAASPDFTAIQLLLSASNSQSGGSASVYLVPDDGTGGSNGVPGNPTYASNNILTSVSAAGQYVGTISDSSLSSTPALTTLFVSSTVLNAISTQNSEYWVTLVLDGSSTIDWSYPTNYSGTGVAGQAIFNNYPGPVGPALTSSDLTPYEMIVDTPEPATLLLLGAGLAGIGLARRRSGGER